MAKKRKSFKKDIKSAIQFAADSVRDFEHSLQWVIRDMIDDAIRELQLQKRLAITIHGDYIQYDLDNRAVYHYVGVGDDYFAHDSGPGRYEPIEDLAPFVPVAQAIRKILGASLPRDTEFSLEYDER